MHASVYLCVSFLRRHPPWVLRQDLTGGWSFLIRIGQTSTKPWNSPSLCLPSTGTTSICHPVWHFRSKLKIELEFLWLQDKHYWLSYCPSLHFLLHLIVLLIIFIISLLSSNPFLAPSKTEDIICTQFWRVKSENIVYLTQSMESRPIDDFTGVACVLSLCCRFGWKVSQGGDDWGSQFRWPWGKNRISNVAPLRQEPGILSWKSTPRCLWLAASLVGCQQHTGLTTLSDIP